MDQLAQHYPQHINELQQRTATILARENIDAIAIHAGQTHKIFLDDMYYPFKVNPHFKAWLPIIDTPNCWLIVDGKNKPVLAFYQPTDFWHKVSTIGNEYWTEFFDIKLMAKSDEISAILPKNKDKLAYLGEHLDIAESLGFTVINPDNVISYFHYHRAYKTDYEFVCLREANRLAVLGHNAAKNAFYAKASEFEIQMAYLQATGQNENEMPYGNIVALNGNTAILHYTVLEKTKPSEHLSFLIDAGASFNGYAADITRTYSFVENEFSELITAVNDMQIELGKELTAGESYVDLHITNHYKLAAILKRFNIVNLEPDAIVSLGITSAFYPHGLGHHLGLQVHDMGGFMADELGTLIAAPKQHPFLRTTRDVECKQVFTIEPGLYFIEEFLSNLKNSDNSQYINWTKVDLLKKFGGIRIEDNIIVHADRNENMTRDLNLA